MEGQAMKRATITKPGLVITRRRGQSVRVTTPTGESLVVTFDRLEHGGRLRLRFLDEPQKHFKITRVESDGGTDR
jgi:hypothetical protein